MLHLCCHVVDDHFAYGVANHYGARKAQPRDSALGNAGLPARGNPNASSLPLFTEINNTLSCLRYHRAKLHTVDKHHIKMEEPDLHHAIALRPRPKYTHRHSEEQTDIELQSPPNYNDANDPYSLRNGLKSASEIGTELTNIKANTSRKRTVGCTPVSKGKDAWKARRLEEFYESQNEKIERLLKPVDDHVREAKEKQDSEALQYKIAVHGSFAVCVDLLSSLLVNLAMAD